MKCVPVDRNLVISSFNCDRNLDPTEMNDNLFDWFEGFDLELGLKLKLELPLVDSIANSSFINKFLDSLIKFSSEE